jgi:hypothetical protein
MPSVYGRELYGMGLYSAPDGPINHEVSGSAAIHLTVKKAKLAYGPAWVASFNPTSPWTCKDDSENTWVKDFGGPSKWKCSDKSGSSAAGN